jgi:CheY-like chemotaxis protein
MDHSIQVLVVDDEPDFLKSIQFWLVSKGYQVNQATSGKSALKMIKQGRQDVVFLDVVMPGMDGIEILRRIRSFNTTLPVILLTVENVDENRFAAANTLGISGLFPKGGSLTQLGEVLEVALRMATHPQSKPPVLPGSGSTPPGTPFAFFRTMRGNSTPPPIW